VNHVYSITNTCKNHPINTKEIKLYILLSLNVAFSSALSKVGVQHYLSSVISLLTAQADLAFSTGRK